jgi:hypothetical protein
MTNEVMKAHLISPVNISPVPGSTDKVGKVVIKEETTISFNMIVNPANKRNAYSSY